MPVIDHPVHPSTKKGDEFRYGCWNRKPFAKYYLVPVRTTSNSYAFQYSTAVVNYTMSKDCKYDMALNDPQCAGCKHINMEVQDVRNQKVPGQ